MCACTSATVRHAVTATQDRGSKTKDHEPLGVVETASGLVSSACCAYPGGGAAISLVRR